MIRQTAYLVWLLLMCMGVLFAQKKELSLNDVALKWYSELAPQRLHQLQWIANTDNFAYVEEVDSIRTLFIGAGKSGQSRPVFDLNDLNQWMESIGMEALKKFPSIRWKEDGLFRFWKGDTLLLGNVKEKSVEIFTYFRGKNAHRDIANKSLAVAFTRENNLYILFKDGKEVAVTQDSLPTLVNGQSVHRNEFGIYKGTFWSPGNNYLAFYRKDESMVTDYPYVDYTTRPAQAKPGKYPMAGMNNHVASVGVYHVQTGKTVWLQTGEPKDQYLTNVTWSPNEKHIYVAHVNRDQNHMRLVRYDVTTGTAQKTLFEEKDEKYVEPQTGPYFVNDDPNRFLWLSRRDGWNHLYVYNSEGKLLRQLTRGEWEVVRVHGFDSKGKYVFITAAKEHPTRRDLYRVEVRTGKMKRITRGEGTHRVSVSHSGKYILDIFSNLRTPAVTSLYSHHGKSIRILKESPNPLEEYRMGSVEILPIELTGGTTLYSRVIYPPDFDAGKKYPLIVYVYGGPHSQLVRDTWLGSASSWGLWLHYLATQGYVVFTVDNRGTSYRGKAFEQATFRRLGTVEIADQLAALQVMKSKPFIDTTRIGVVGWSYGGFMATSLMLRSPGTFKAAIGGAPVIDWKYYETIYTERYMDTPESNPEGYETSSTLNYVDNLENRLLLIQGTSDDVVMWQHTILFIRAAIKAGKQPDYFIYPGHRHGIRGKDRLHLLQRMTAWFEEHL